jgi:mannose-6-phosphate isomerase-like protein (cupin superfamily)
MENSSAGVLPARLRLPFMFDAARLAADADAFAPEEWERHFNTGYYEGDWSGVALRSCGGRLSLYSDPALSAFEDTAALARCPGVRAVLAAFRCPLTAVRFLRLGPGARIREHRDYALGFDYGEVRVHVPVHTSPHVEFVLAGSELKMEPGECWYLDVSRPHRVANLGSEPRVHLVIDCTLDDWLRGVLDGAARAPA